MTMIMLSLLLLACPTDECRNPDYGSICDDFGMCWVRADDWATWAWAHDAVGTQEGVESGVLFPSPPPVQSPDVECWRYGSEDDWAHVCLISTLCLDLTAKPVDELVDVGGPCQGDPFGAWDYTVETAVGCYGVFADLEIATRLLVD